jgi:hypothetical protein
MSIKNRIGVALHDVAPQAIDSGPASGPIPSATTKSSAPKSSAAKSATTTAESSSTRSATRSAAGPAAWSTTPKAWSALPWRHEVAHLLEPLPPTPNTSGSRSREALASGKQE